MARLLSSDDVERHSHSSTRNATQLAERRARGRGRRRVFDDHASFREQYGSNGGQVFRSAGVVDRPDIYFLNDEDPTAR